MNTKESTNANHLHYDEYNTCLICGCLIPEGIMVCPSCETQILAESKGQVIKKTTNKQKKSCTLLEFFKRIFTKKVKTK